MKNDFRVALRFEAMTFLLKLRSQRLKIIDFAIADDPHRPILVADRLMATCKVNDAQSPLHHTDLVTAIISLIVRTAMDHHARHTPQNGLVDVATIQIENSSDTTHSFWKVTFNFVVVPLGIGCTERADPEGPTAKAFFAIWKKT
jgi:hypothetical protein